MNDKKIFHEVLKIYPDKNYSLSEIKEINKLLYKNICLNAKNRGVTPTKYLQAMDFHKNVTQKNAGENSVKSYDVTTMKKLYNQFQINQSEIADFLGCARNNINLKMKKGSDFDKNKWLIPFNELEIKNLVDLISSGKDEFYTEEFSFKIVHGKKNFYNEAIILKNRNTIKVDFEIHSQIRKALEKSKLNRSTAEELIKISSINDIWIDQGRKYQDDKKMIKLSAEQKRPFYRYAKIKGEEINQYFANFNYCLEDSRKTAEENIINKIKKYADENHNIHLCSNDEDYTFFANRASRNDESIYDFFKFYGYNYERSRVNYNNINREDIHKNIIESRYLVKDNYIYISSYDQYYATLTSYARMKGEKLDEMIERFGYIRIKNKKDLPNGFKCYDYSLNLSKNQRLNDDNIFISLSSISTADNKVYLDISTYFYYILFLKAKIEGLDITSLVSNYGFERVFSPINESLSNSYKRLENELEEDYKKYIYEKLNELKTLESKYKVKTSHVESLERNTQLIKILKELYQGKCQLCNPQNPIPAICKKDGEIYSEVHHINSLHNATCDDDINFIDSYKNTIVLCPYHHKYLHYHHGGFNKMVKIDNILYLENEEGEKIKIFTNHHLDIK